MNTNYESFRDKAASLLSGLAKESSDYSDARMLVASADTSANLKKNVVRKSIDLEWIEKIEAAIPYLDVVIRNPSVAIEEVEEILPVELTRKISDKSIKHLSQHTNLILSIDGDEVTPSKVLNVFREETHVTYENKFVNTLLVRLAAFADKRYKMLEGRSGVEENYQFGYTAEFEHFQNLDEDTGRNSAKVHLSIELTSPMTEKGSNSDEDINARYKDALARVRKISLTISSYLSSPFAQKLGRNFIRPPVIRTNAILKNKNLKECLTLWEYIETCEKIGYSFVADEFKEMPSDHYISDLYSAVALQYTQFYNGVINNEDTRLLSKKHLQETYPDFDGGEEEEIEDFLVFDSEYKKVVPVSRLMNNRKKLSEDERRIREEIDVALKADELITARILAEEEERRARELEERRARELEERRLRELEAKRRAEEEERMRMEEARELAEEAETIKRELEAEGAHIDPADKDVEEKIEALAKLRHTYGKRAESLNKRAFGFIDDEIFVSGRIIIPFTMQQYLAMSRKRKKNILLTVRRISEYKRVKIAMELLTSLASENPRILARVERLKLQLEELRGIVPVAEYWEAAVTKKKGEA